MNRKPVLAAVLTVLGVIAVGSTAQAADPRVEQLLKRGQLAYDTDEGGDYVVPINFEDQRSQVVLITSETAKLDALEMREVWTMAYAVKGSLSAALANRLLQQNRELTVGSWQVVVENGESLVLFGAQIPVATSAAELREVLEIVAGLADELEKEMTKKDEY